MKILFIIDAIDSGGVSVVLRSMLKHINLNKYNIDLLTFEENTEYENQIPDGVKIIHAYRENPAKKEGRIVRYIYAIFKEIVPKAIIRRKFQLNKYDLVIDFKGNNLNVATAAICKTVYWCHKDYSPISNPMEKNYIEEYSRTINGKFKERMLRKNIENIDQIVCISDYTSEAFRERWKYQKKIAVVHNILDIDAVRNKALEPIAYKKRGFTFCCMSRISKGKGIERLLECVENLNKEGYSFYLDIVGDGDGLNDIRNMLNRLNLENVRLLGHKSNPYPYPYLSDVFVCPSETESYGMALCEAIITGAPVIMTDVGTSREIMDSGTYGLLVESSKNGIYNAMKIFLDDPNMTKKYRRPLLQQLPYFDIDNRVKENEAFLDDKYE
jgi:glycosyltransferase involved in cell wall biosynthesis